MRAFFLLLVFVVIAPASAHAQPYLPLAIGNFWQYLGVGGEQETQTVIGTVPIWGEDVWLIRYSESTNNNGLDNFWTAEPDGDVAKPELGSKV